MEKGGKAQGRNPPPAAAQCLTSCLRRACVVPATCVLRREDDKGAPPPHTPPPPQGWGMKVGGRGKRPPPPRTKRQGGEAAERGCGTDHKTVPVGSTRRASPNGGTTGGANAGYEGRQREPHGKPPPPPCRGTSDAPRACAVLATCLRQRTDSEDAPPPNPLLPHPPRKGARTARRRRGDIGGGGAEDIPKRRGERRVASRGDTTQPEPQNKNKANQCARAGTNSRDARDTAGIRERGKGRGNGGHP